MFVKHYVPADFILFLFYFYVWDNQGVGCLSAFIMEFKQRFTDIRWQAWDDHINTSDRLSLHRLAFNPT